MIKNLTWRVQLFILFSSSNSTIPKRSRGIASGLHGPERHLPSWPAARRGHSPRSSHFIRWNKRYSPDCLPRSCSTSAGTWIAKQHANFCAHAGSQIVAGAGQIGSVRKSNKKFGCNKFQGKLELLKFLTCSGLAVLSILVFYMAFCKKCKYLSSKISDIIKTLKARNIGFSVFDYS